MYKKWKEHAFHYVQKNDASIHVQCTWNRWFSHSWNSIHEILCADVVVVHRTLSSSSNFQVYHSLSQQRLLLLLLLCCRKNCGALINFVNIRWNANKNLGKHPKRFVYIGQCAVYSMFWANYAKLLPKSKSSDFQFVETRSCKVQAVLKIMQFYIALHYTELYPLFILDFCRT